MRCKHMGKGWHACMAIFVVSVLPAPDSPLMTSPWSLISSDIALYALEVVRKT